MITNYDTALLQHKLTTRGGSGRSAAAFSLPSPNTSCFWHARVDASAFIMEISSFSDLQHILMTLWCPHTVCVLFLASSRNNFQLFVRHDDVVRRESHEDIPG